MELLAYSDTDDEEETTQTKESGQDVVSGEVKHVVNKWAVVESSDDEDNTTDDIVDESLQSTGPVSIPAEVLLSNISEKPSFLFKPPSQKKFEIKAVVNTVYQANPLKPPPQNAVTAKLEQAVKIKAVTRERFLLEQAKKEKEAPKLSAADEDLNSKLMASDKDKDKDLTAKDRVKRQRLAGQSGIGEDFKSWKSEEEMRQRQHYD